MAAITPVLSNDGAIQYGNRTTRLAKESGTGVNNAEADSLLTALAVTKRLLYVTVSYSANPTYTASVTVTLDSGLGTVFDIGTSDPLFVSATDGLQDIFFQPSYDLILASNDQLTVTAPDGGGAIVVSIAVVWEQLG